MRIFLVLTRAVDVRVLEGILESVKYRMLFLGNVTGNRGFDMSRDHT